MNTWPADGGAPSSSARPGETVDQKSDRAPQLILHVIGGLQVGGAEMMMERLIVAQNDNPAWRHQVISLTVLGDSIGPRLLAHGVQIDALDMRSMLDAPRVVVQLARRIRRYRPAIVQCWMYHADLLAGIASRLAGHRRVLWGVRIADIAPGVASSLTMKIRWVSAFLSRHIPQRIVYVARSAQRAHEAAGYAPSKSIFIPNGYAIPDLAKVEAAGAKIRAQLGIPVDTVLIGCVGRFSPQKDQRGFVAAARLISEVYPEAHFAMIGNGVDPANAQLAEWIAATGIGERFHLMGLRSDVTDCMAAMDVFVLNSIEEGFPNVLAEAMSVARSVVATDVGDSAYICADIGTVIPPRDPAALADAVSRLIQIGSKERQRIGQKGRERIIEHFSMGPISEQYELLYRDLLATDDGPATEQG